MRQIALFDGSDHLAAPLARKTDPDTSHAAACEYRDSGKLTQSKAAVLTAVRKRGGLTAVELALMANLDRYEVSRRLADLRKAGLIRCGESRLCDVHQRKMQTWWAV